LVHNSGKRDIEWFLYSPAQWYGLSFRDPNDHIPGHRDDRSSKSRDRTSGPAAPTITITPSSGTGTGGSLSILADDVAPGGFTNIQWVSVEFAGYQGLGTTPNCQATVFPTSPTTSTIWLIPSNNHQYLPGHTPTIPGDPTLDDPVCALDLSRSSLVQTSSTSKIRKRAAWLPIPSRQLGSASLDRLPSTNRASPGSASTRLRRKLSGTVRGPLYKRECYAALSAAFQRPAEASCQPPRSDSLGLRHVRDYTVSLPTAASDLCPESRTRVLPH
jgi:hypothetical protein